VNNASIVRRIVRESRYGHWKATAVSAARLIKSRMTLSSRRQRRLN
jgi:hypothetical protein